MITVFSNPRPFIEPFKTMQYNAIRSWLHLHPDVQIILFEDENGTTQKVAKELNTQYVNDIQTNEFGTPLIDGVFTQMRNLAKNDIVVQVNADIILTQSFLNTIVSLEKTMNGDQFLMIGRRWDLDVTTEIEFDQTNRWEKEILQRVKKEACRSVERIWT